MHHHFDNGLHVKSLLLNYRPKILLELGAARGANTVQLLSLRDQYPFKLITISDGPLAAAYYEVSRAHNENRDYQWIEAKSYDAIPHLQPDGTIEFVSIDTTHNYETLKRELDALHPKLFSFCIIVFHDTFSEDYDEKMAKPGGKKMKDAIAEFMAEHPEFTVLRETKESCGAMAIARGMVFGWQE